MVPSGAFLEQALYDCGILEEFLNAIHYSPSPHSIEVPKPEPRKTCRVLFVSPFGFDSEHHGARRLSRFAKWLSQDGWVVRTVTASPMANSHAIDLAVVRDPLGVWPRSEPSPRLLARPSIASLSHGRGWGRHLIPDPTIGWAIATLLSRSAHRLAKWSDVIVSSSPPESPHLAACLLARSHGKPHIVDMRDGWFDEPLRPELSTCSLRARTEQALENHILRAATAIIVTSPEWKRALLERYPAFAAKAAVVRNAVSRETLVAARHKTSLPRTWVYAGRFGGSRPSQNPCLLLQQLRREATAAVLPIHFRFVGALSASELGMLREFQSFVRPTGSTVTLVGQVPHAEAISEVNQADALLLLCASHHALPSKLFEYAATGKPILAVCRAGSATWNACSGIMQAMRVDPDEQPACARFSEFAELPPTAGIDAELRVNAAQLRLLAVFRDAVRLTTSSDLQDL